MYEIKARRHAKIRSLQSHDQVWVAKDPFGGGFMLLDDYGARNYSPDDMIACYKNGKLIFDAETEQGESDA